MSLQRQELKHTKATEETQPRNENAPQKANRGLNFKKHVENIKKGLKKKKKLSLEHIYASLASWRG